MVGNSFGPAERLGYQRNFNDLDALVAHFVKPTDGAVYRDAVQQCRVAMTDDQCAFVPSGGVSGWRWNAWARQGYHWEEGLGPNLLRTLGVDHRCRAASRSLVMGHRFGSAADQGGRRRRISEEIRNRRNKGIRGMKLDYPPGVAEFVADDVLETLHVRPDHHRLAGQNRLDSIGLPLP